MKVWIKLNGTKKDIEQAISELRSNNDKLEIEIIMGGRKNE